MDSTNLYYGQKPIIPPLKMNNSSYHTQLSLSTQQADVKIPPFPSRPVHQLSGFKRQNPLFFEQALMREPAPSKKVKFGAFNVFSKANFTEKDPYWPAGHSSETVQSKKTVCPTVNYQKLNNKIISSKGITINISVKPREEVRSIPKFSTSTNKENQIMFERQRQMNSFPSKLITPTFNVNEAKEPIYNAICQKLEENCQALFQSMKDLIILRQHFNSGSLKIPTLDRAFEETMPGTPCTISEGKSEVESSFSEIKLSKTDSEISEVQSKDEKEQESPEENIKKEKRTYRRREKKVTSPVQGSSETPRRMNRLQVLRSERQEVEVEAKKPYVISLHGEDGVMTRVGAEYQASVPGLEKEKVEKKQLKLRSSPETSC